MYLGQLYVYSTYKISKYELICSRALKVNNVYFGLTMLEFIDLKTHDYQQNRSSVFSAVTQ